MTATIGFFERSILLIRSLNTLMLGVTMFLTIAAYGQTNPGGRVLIDVGVARIDITPEGPIRLGGYAARKHSESEGIIHRLQAKALAFGTDDQGPSIFITVDLLGIPGHVTRRMVDSLSKKIKIDQAQIAISSSHTHGSPEVGSSLSVLQYRGENFSDSLLSLTHLIHTSQYIDQLAAKLEGVAIAAMNDRKPSLLSWGQGQAGFAKNRRTDGGPVDPSLPMLRVADPNGNTRAILINYACHGTTLEGNVNKIHGDWIAEAQKVIEAKHPGVTAMVAIGCGGDADPHPRGKMEHVTMHAQEIATNIDKLLASQLIPLTTPPVGRIKWVTLPFAHVPSVPELIKQTEDKTIKGYYARLALDRIARGQAIAPELDYPIQVWTFGDQLAMINLAGEVVVDYAVRLKNELGAEKLWVNGYTNDVPCYIASRRVIREGGYEGESSMYWYDKPSPFVEEVEDIIISAVHDLVPSSFKEKRPDMNKPILIEADENNVFHLDAASARAIGPEIKYMPEWKAFGWFTEADRVEWDVHVTERGQYDVYLDWSVSDDEAGKPFVLVADRAELKGKIAKTGSWFTYRNEKIGRLTLRPGDQKIVFRPGEKSEKGALLDLRTIRLVRVK